MDLPSFPDLFNLADYFLFDRVREGRGERVALRFGPHALGYREVADAARGVSHLLQEGGLPRGGRVLVILRDIPAFAWAFFGALAAGGVVVMGNPDAPLETLRYLMDYADARVIIAPVRIARALLAHAPPGAQTAFFVVDEPGLEGAPRGRCGPGELPAGARCLESALGALPAAADLRPAVSTHRDEPAIWLLTSGSTGMPKAAMHAHRDFAFSCEVFAKGTMGLESTDVCVSVPRLFFGYATGTNLMFPFAVGASVGLYPERPTPESLLAAIERYEPTVLTLVPTLMGKLLEHDAALRASGKPGLDLSRVRFSYSAGEALPGALLERWRRRFGSEVFDGIGSAEMFHIYATNRPGDVKVGSLGRAVAGYELKILTEDAEGAGARPVAPGEIGVLWVRGDSVAFGYWRDRDKSWATFHGKWCRTGDLFHVDADGYLYFDGRADDLLKVSGIFVAPIEVEDCLMKHEAVALTAVIGADDQGLLKPKALVVVKQEHRHRLASAASRAALRAELKEHVKARLAPHKYPRFVVFADDLPKNDRGKVDRKLLKEQEARGDNREEP